MQLSASAEFGKLKLDIWRVLEEEVTRARAEMERMSSSKTQERLLYLISPIGLLAALAGAADGRHRRPPLRAGAERHRAGATGRWWRAASSRTTPSVTLYRVFAGFFIGSIPGIAVGLLMAMFRPVRIFFDPLIAALFPIPKIALMPLLLLAFGFGDASKIALVVIAVFFPVVVNTYVGAANIEKIYWDVAKNYGASQSVIFRRIVFFGALPMIFAGLRIALAVSFIVLVAAEFVATKAGIGYLIWNSWELLQVDVMFVGIVTVGILGLIATVVSAGDRAQGHPLEGGVGRRVAPAVMPGLGRHPGLTWAAVLMTALDAGTARHDAAVAYFFGFQSFFHAGGSSESISTKQMRHGLPDLLTQAWLVPCCTSTSPALQCTSVSSSSMSISPSMHDGVVDRARAVGVQMCRW